MKSLEVEILDLALTQAIERYLEMESLIAAHKAIRDEWPEQIAALLMEFVIRAMTGRRDGIPETIFAKRASGHSTYIALIHF
jgi:hypothetical protein